MGDVIDFPQKAFKYKIEESLSEMRTSLSEMYAALEKDFILEKLKVDVQDQTHLQKIILSIIKAIKNMEKQLPWPEKNYYKLI